jgi:hypothetical protein
MALRPGSQASILGIIALGPLAVAAAIAWLVVLHHPATGSSEATPVGRPLSVTP